MNMSPHSHQPLSPLIRSLLRITALIDATIGLLFLIGPEIGVTPWVTPIAPVLMRFIGAIIAGNALGAWLAARQGTWQGARVLFTVALLYGLIILVALPYHLLFRAAPPILWAYVAADAVFLIPILMIFWMYERPQMVSSPVTR